MVDHNSLDGVVSQLSLSVIRRLADYNLALLAIWDLVSRDTRVTEIVFLAGESFNVWRVLLEVAGRAAVKHLLY